MLAVLTSFGLYSWAHGAHAPMALAIMLALSTWHIVENDQALAAAYANDLKVGRVSRSLDQHVMVLSVTAVLVGVSAATLHGGAWRSWVAVTPLANFDGKGILVVAALGGLWLLVRSAAGLRGAFGLGLLGAAAFVPERLDRTWIGFSDVFSAVILYHLIGWLVLFHDRGRDLVRRGRREEARGVMLRVAAVHVPPVVVCALLIMGPSSPGWETARFWAFSPSIYLFWSVLHVLQTLLSRVSTPHLRATLHEDGLAGAGLGR